MKTKKLFHRVYGERPVKFDHKSDDQFIIWTSSDGEKYTTFKSEFLDVCKGYLADTGYKIANITKHDNSSDLVCIELEYYPDFVFGTSEYDAVIKATKLIYKLVKKIEKAAKLQAGIDPKQDKGAAIDKASSDSIAVDAHRWLGYRIDVAINGLLAMANDAGKTHTMVFNNIEVVAAPGADATEIEEAWCKARDVANEVWKNSDRAKALHLEGEEKRTSLQAAMDDGIDKLKSLNFNDQAAILDWICLIQDASDHRGVEVDKNLIIDTFSANGYYPDVNLGENFNGDDADNFARYIIGQALSGLKTVGAIHHVALRFINDWKEEFPSNSN